MTNGEQCCGGGKDGGQRRDENTKAFGGVTRGVNEWGGETSAVAAWTTGAGMTTKLLHAAVPVKLLRACAALVVLASSLALAACGGAQQQKSAAPPKSDFERSLDTVRRGSYVRIYVIRRADGQPLAAEDRLFLRQNTPMETGMWVVTEDGRAAIAGAGFEFEPKHLQALSARFTVEDYTGK